MPPSLQDLSAARNGRARQIERKRRMLSRLLSRRPPIELFVRLTWSSFAMEQLTVDPLEVADAIGAGSGPRRFRQPRVLRIRNHVAVLRRIERAVKRGEALKCGTVLRWYTSISCGLSIAAVVDEGRIGRIEECLRRINSPHLHLQQAVSEAASLHAQLLSNPIFPGFNGILARLLLQYHLARCGLPPVAFDPQRDRETVKQARLLSARLVDLIEESYDWLLARHGSEA